MKTQELKYVTRRRAAVLLGLSEMELSRISSESGFDTKKSQASTKRRISRTKSCDRSACWQCTR